MKINTVFVLLFFLYSGAASGFQQVFSVLPTGATFANNIPVSSQQVLFQQQQQPLFQLVRQQTPVLTPGGTGLTQVIGPSGTVQLIGQQPYPTTVTQVGGGFANTAGVSPLVITSNGVSAGGVTSTTTNVPYPYAAGGFTTTNVNGVPVLMSSTSTGGLGVVNGGFSGNPLQTMFVQPVTSINPVVRQVPDEIDIVSADTIDPLDAALLNMENNGQMHMEKYAWGRSAPLTEKPTPKDDAASQTNDAISIQQLRAAPLYYANNPVASLQPPSIRVKSTNPFVDSTGQRKKHFELYQYFRNLNPIQYAPVNSVPAIVPFAGPESME